MDYLCRPLKFDLKKYGCANNQQKSSTTKIGDHTPCGYSRSTIWLWSMVFDNKKTSIYCIVENIV